MKSHWPEIPVYGSMIEASECLTRLIGQMNALLWMAEYPGPHGSGDQSDRRPLSRVRRAELAAGAGLLDGFVIWGDVAYKKCMFFAPSYWREYFKPWVARITDAAHAAGLPVIYHGCGNVKAILPDFIEIGVDGYNPLEAKAGLDVLDLRRQYGHRMAFCGNSAVPVWESGDGGRFAARSSAS